MIPLLEATLGLDFLNTHMIELSNYLGKFTTTHLTAFTDLARVLGAIFAMITVAMHLYKTMGRGEAIDILAIAKPILFAFVLAWWSAFCNLLMYPGTAMEKHFSEVFEIEKNKIYELREKRNEAAWKYSDKVRERKAAAEQAKQSAGQDSDQNVISAAMDFLSDAGNWLLEQVKSWALIAETHLADCFESFIMWMGELFWQCAVYFSFLIKNIYLCVLTMFGPVFVITSILPAWQGKWAEWVGKVIHVSFYGVMAYIVMIFTLQLMYYTIDADIKVLTKMTADLDIGEYSSGLFGSSCLTLVAMIVGYQALKMVPELASWVFPASPIQSTRGFIQGMINNTQGMGQKGASMAYKAIK